MFGYVIVNKQELKFREFDCYQSYYLSLIHISPSMKEKAPGFYLTWSIIPV